MSLAADASASSLATTASADSSDSWLTTLCKEAKLSEASAALLLAAEIDLSEWLALLGDARPAFLKQLQQLGIAKLSERQGIANVLAKLKREARLPEELENLATRYKVGEPLDFTVEVDVYPQLQIEEAT